MGWRGMHAGRDADIAQLLLNAMGTDMKRRPQAARQANLSGARSVC